MKVHGTEGLRVVEARVMPYITNGNLYAPMMMLAEKAADLIKGNRPLDPEPLPFYRKNCSSSGRPLRLRWAQHVTVGPTSKPKRGTHDF